MDWQNEKCVMVIDESLPLGIIANTAAIMGITLGKNAGGSRGHVPESTLQYFGVAICGPKKKVNKLTGSMPLLR